MSCIISDFDRFSWATCPGGLTDDPNDRVQPIAERLLSTIKAIDKWETEHQQNENCLVSDFNLFTPHLEDHFYFKWTALDANCDHQRRCLCFSMSYDPSVLEELGRRLGKCKYDFLAADHFLKHMDNNVHGLSTNIGKHCCPCHAVAERFTVDDIKKILMQAEISKPYHVINFIIPQ